MTLCAYRRRLIDSLPSPRCLKPRDIEPQYLILSVFFLTVARTIEAQSHVSPRAVGLKQNSVYGRRLADQRAHLRPSRTHRHSLLHPPEAPYLITSRTTAVRWHKNDSKSTSWNTYQEADCTTDAQVMLMLFHRGDYAFGVIAQQSPIVCRRVGFQGNYCLQQ